MKRGVHAVAWVALVVAALALWPQRWGGSMTYVVTSGTSMQPAFVAGDVAVLRKADDYAVGDVIAFRSAELKRIVMHRVIEETPAGLTTQGDNNDFVDPETIRESEVLGRLLVRVPGVGRALDWFLQPLNLGLAAGALLLLLSDRRPRPADAPPSGRPPLGTIELLSLEIPPGSVRAAVSTRAELDRLAAHYDRPVLTVPDEGASYVLDGAVVYVHVPAASRPAERRVSPHGRDWGYPGADVDEVVQTDEPAMRHLRAVPAPRGAAEQLVS